MNSKFVNVKYDMEKEEGLTFNQKYPDAIKAYPTMLIINTTGEIIHKIVGSMPAEELLRNRRRITRKHDLHIRKRIPKRE